MKFRTIFFVFHPRGSSTMAYNFRRNFHNTYLPFRRDVETKRQSRIVIPSTIYRKVRFVLFLRAQKAIIWAFTRGMFENRVEKSYDKLPVYLIERKKEPIGIGMGSIGFLYLYNHEVCLFFSHL